MINRLVNPFVRALLRSPLHGLLSARLVLITVTGRRSRRSFTIPVGYRRTGDDLTITVGSPERKRWWRNLGEEGHVALVLDGTRRSGVARARTDDNGAVTVDVRLDPPDDRPPGR